VLPGFRLRCLTRQVAQLRASAPRWARAAPANVSIARLCEGTAPPDGNPF
jgi:hypothetical protein